MKLVNRSYDEIQRGNLAAAERYLEDALETNPRNPYTLLNIGYVFQKTGRYAEARSMYEKVIALPSDKTSRRTKPRNVSEDSLKGLSLLELARHNLAMLPAFGARRALDSGNRFD